MLTCDICGQQSPEGFRFCGACGAELRPPATREVRKMVTVLFADVTGSTALGERLDPESFRRVMSRYFEEMKVALERHGGTVEKFIGDAVMAVFGIPSVHEDDARRALLAATDMRERLANLNTALERDFGVRLEARIGVNTGEVVTGQAESGERLATGDAVNVAARLEQKAAPGDILVGGQTLELAREGIEVEQVEPLLLKGKAEPVDAYRLLRIVDVIPEFERRIDAPFVGRREELGRVQGAFHEAVAERRCRLVTVFGPPGIGKSRFARELAAHLQAEGHVFSGRCLPYGEGITYWPIREIFVAANAEDEFEAALAAGVPEEIFWAIRKAFERRARQRPLVLVVEDIHWAEPTLLDLIEHLTEWTRDAQLLLLCLARPELLDERPAWGSARPNAETMTLQPLTETDADELIDGLLGGSRLENDTRTRIRQVAEGNPLFVEQLLAMVAEGGAADRVPATIHALLAARLDGLPDDERDVLERASVVGLEFEWEALAQLAPDQRRPPGARLAALVRKELIQPHEAVDDTFRFRHLLIRDAAYDRVPKELRSHLHERFADWVDGRGEEFDEIVGYHAEQAYLNIAELGPPGDRGHALAERAAQRLAESGRRAYGRGDQPAAANLLERATSLLPASDRRRLELLPRLGRALTETGRLEAADSVLSDAIERGRASGARAVAADATAARCYLRFLTAAGAPRTENERELEEAIRAFQELGDEAGLARALGVAGALRFWWGEAAAAINDLERAAECARRASDQALEAEILRYVITASLWGPSPVDAALERVDELSRASTDRRLMVTSLRIRAELEAMQGRFDTARDLIAQARSLAEELGLEVVLMWGVAHNAGRVELLAGDPAAAEGELRPACETLERMGNWGATATLAPDLADSLHAQGKDEEALRFTDPAGRVASPEDTAPRIGWRRVRGKVLARRGETEEAERLAREATSLGARSDYLDLRARAVSDLAEVLSLAGRPEESAVAAREAISLYEAKGNIVAARTLRGLLAKPPANA